MTINNPSLDCPSDIVVNAAAGQCGATVTYTPPTSSCGAVTCTPPSGSFFPVGTTPIACSTQIGQSCSFNVTVADHQPPTISVSLSPTVLTPPNHTLRDITATVSISDNCPGATFILSSLTSNEPDNGLGDGDLPGDIQDAAIGTPDLAFKLRAERAGLGSGRTYTATYTARDAAGNTASASAQVTVPVSQKLDPSLPPTITSTTRPDHIFLGQNYPNPFNPTTLISYGLPTDAGVSIAVYDLLGRKVTQLVEERVSAGYRNVEFDGSGLPSGWYFYRMTAVADDGTTFSETKKLLLLR
ncbi:MAG: T9SS type A sorting domain-containing protein [Ignavibacteriae bacterium]|nr:T9SS type A sorting domain-containing protein [Ignavibacteria bacterium]MBI3363699.1 T9SS type A sorting domain-containing protein [Ignavibacteriota bacterium]